MEQKNNENDGWQAFWGMIAVGIVIWLILGGIMRCAGIKGGDHINNAPWEPRHTQIQTPIKPDVNRNIVITDSKL